MSKYTYNDYCKRHLRTNFDWEGFGWLVMYIVTGIMAFAAVIGILVIAYQNIKIFNVRLEASQIVNDEINKLYNSISNVDKDIITKEQYETRKKIYEEEELKRQQEGLIKSQTALSKKKCEVGSYIMIKNGREPVRVTSIEGYIAYTHENISFVPVETDTWYYLSAKEYAFYCKIKGREPYFVNIK